MAASRSEPRRRTTDLALATYLTLEGFDLEMVQVDGEEVKPGQPQGAWECRDTGTLRDLVAEFENGEALVDPKEFQECLNATRRAMFKFLGIGQ